MRIIGSKDVIGQATMDTMKANFPGYLSKALRRAGEYVPGAVGGPFQPGHYLVIEWFGAQPDRNTVLNGLRRIRDACGDYRVSAKNYERTIQWCLSSGVEHHDVGTFGAAYRQNIIDINKHFTLRIYAGRGLMATPYGWRVNTLFHELSHRIINTADVVDAVCGNAKCYGAPNSRNLAAAHPDLAATNASNWAFFICACNGITDDEA